MFLRIPSSFQNNFAPTKQHSACFVGTQANFAFSLSLATHGPIVFASGSQGWPVAKTQTLQLTVMPCLLSFDKRSKHVGGSEHLFSPQRDPKQFTAVKSINEPTNRTTPENMCWPIPKVTGSSKGCESFIVCACLCACMRACACSESWRWREIPPSYFNVFRPVHWRHIFLSSKKKKARDFFLIKVESWKLKGSRRSWQQIMLKL